MNLIPIALDVDGSISLQTNLSSKVLEVVKLNQLENKLRLWANKNGIRALKQVINELRERYANPWLTFIGSGDLHHLTLLLLESLPEKFKPLTLIVLDNHPDWFTQPPVFHCGNWVSGAVKLSWVESIILVGQDSDDLKGINFLFSPIKELVSGRVNIYPYKRKKTLIPFKWIKHLSCIEETHIHFYGTEILYKPVRPTGVRNFFKELSESLKNKNVYISIDKDCLRNEFAITNWEEGQLSLDDVKTAIEELMKNCNVVGADICGEKSPKPLKGLLKRIDSNRIFNQNFEDFSYISKINEETNLELLKLFLNLNLAYKS